MSEIGTPEVRERSGPSIVWLIPLVTALVGGWLIVKTLTEQGPTATISFRTAEGLEIGKTKIRYKSVEIGVVEDIRFSEDFERVLVTAQFNQGMRNFLRRNTRFWVVKPELSVRGVSGLSTLVSGAYIEIDPGPGAPQRFFLGLEKRPVVSSDDEGSQITLVTDNLGSLSTGSPIYYRGIEAGEVLGYELGSDRQSVYLPVFVRAPFDQLLRGNTKFWNVSGMEISAGADGFEINTESVESMMFGGIAFETPPSLDAVTGDVDNLIFTLYEDYDDIEAQAFTRKINFVMYFSGSVRGLNPGAPVEFRGIRVGTVLDVRLEFDSAEDSFRIPVLVEIEPERVIDRSAAPDAVPQEQFQRWVERGLRARLQTGSLLTGQLFVELDMHPETDIRLVGNGSAPYPELPTIPSGIETLTRTVEEFAAKLDRVDLDGIADNLLGTLEGTNRIANSEALASTLDDLGGSMAALRALLEDQEAGIPPTVDAARRALDDLDETVRLVNQALDPDAPLQYNLTRTIGELEETARAIRALVEALERRPNALIFGREDP